MENYISEIASICKLPFKEIIDDFKIIQIGSRMIHVSNYKKIITYTTEQVILKIKKNTLEINGSELVLAMINKCEIIIKGNINSIALGVVNEKGK